MIRIVNTEGANDSVHNVKERTLLKKKKSYMTQSKFIQNEFLRERNQGCATYREIKIGNQDSSLEHPSEFRFSGEISISYFCHQ